MEWCKTNRIWLAGGRIIAQFIITNNGWSLCSILIIIYLCRVQLLTKRRDRQVTELLSLEEEVEEVDMAGQNLMTRLENVEERCHYMIERLDIHCMIY